MVRRDAQARRETLLDAAATCFAAQGFGVSLDEIAKRAGVGRGTLYRNFRDRMALALAIFEREVDRFGDALLRTGPVVEVLGELVRQGRPAHLLFARLAAELPPQGEDLAAFEALGARFERLVTPLAERGRETGELRRDVSAAELVLALRMVGGLLVPLRHDEAKAERVIADALALLLAGLRR